MTTRIRRDPASESAEYARCRWISGLRLIAMHGTQLAGLLRASSAGVWPAISSR